jgi:hypothetical protein
MGEATARLGLPFIIPGQAQKEVFHNEALVRLDIAVAAAVEGVASSPPATPEQGQCWVVGNGASGVWTGHGDALACWTGGGWRFVAAVPGMLVWHRAAQLWMHWDGVAWNEGSLPVSRIVVGGQQVVGARQPAIANPSDGTIIDAECRSAVAAVIVALKSHGLIE